MEPFIPTEEEAFCIWGNQSERREVLPSGSNLHLGTFPPIWLVQSPNFLPESLMSSNQCSSYLCSFCYQPPSAAAATELKQPQVKLFPFGDMSGFSLQERRLIYLPHVHTMTYTLDLTISPSRVTKLDALASALFSWSRDSVIQLAATLHRKKQLKTLRTSWNTPSFLLLRRKAASQRLRSSKLMKYSISYFNPYLTMSTALVLYLISGFYCTEPLSSEGDCWNSGYHLQFS